MYCIAENNDKKTNERKNTTRKCQYNVNEKYAAGQCVRFVNNRNSFKVELEKKNNSKQSKSKEKKNFLFGTDHSYGGKLLYLLQFCHSNRRNMRWERKSNKKQNRIFEAIMAHDATNDRLDTDVVVLWKQSKYSKKIYLFRNSFLKLIELNENAVEWNVVWLYLHSAKSMRHGGDNSDALFNDVLLPEL